MINYNNDGELIIEDITREEYFNLSMDTYFSLSPLEHFLLVEKYGEPLDFTISLRDLFKRYDVSPRDLPESLLSKRFVDVFVDYRVAGDKVYFNGSDGSRLILNFRKKVDCLIYEYKYVSGVHQTVYDINGFKVSIS